MDPNGYSNCENDDQPMDVMLFLHVPHLGQSLNRLHIQVVGGFVHCDEMRLGPEPAALAIVFMFFPIKNMAKV